MEPLHYRGRRAVVPSHVLVQELPNGEVVLLDLESERYFGLDSVGAKIWTALTASPTVDDALSDLERMFDVDGSRLRSDVEDVLDQVTQRGLLDLER